MLRISLFFALIVLLSHTSADAFNVKVSPSKINPGDVFAVRVSGVTTSETPSAFFEENRITFSSCGDSCFIGIGVADIDTKPGIHKMQVYVGDKRISRNLSIKRARFPRKFLRLPDDKVFLSRQDSERTEREGDKLKTIYSTVTNRLWEGNYILPLENRISTAFGVKRILNRKKPSVHEGVDIKGREGDEVKAANRGRVVLAEELFFGGNTLILDHGQGIFTIYMHLSEFDVKYGDVVSNGDRIGLVGSSGRSTGPHLHFGVKVMQVSANPISLVKLKL